MLIVAVVAALSAWRWQALLNSRRPSAPSAGMRSIAVLPLENLSGDPAQEYFADGMTDELITDLAKISGLRVISRTSVMKFKGEHREQLPEIATALGVNTIVEGSVLRVGDKVRITAQLIDAPSDKHLWEDSYERDTRDVLTLQDEVASAIAQQIDVELTPGEQARLAKPRPINPQAYEAYLKGRYFMSTYRVDPAVEQYELAIKTDPDFALAYTGLADAYMYGEDLFFPGTEVMPKAKAAAEKALQLDDSLAEAHTSMGAINFWYDFDWTGGERELRRAIALNPSSGEAHFQYGYLLMFEGRFDESLAEMRRASDLDPLSAEYTNDVALPLMYQAKYEAAQEQCRKALELAPGFDFAQMMLGNIDCHAGKFSQAITEYKKALELTSNRSLVLAALGYAYAKNGERAKAQAIVEELNQMSSRRYISPLGTAMIYVGLGEKQQALDGLEKAYAARSQFLCYLKIDKIWDPLSSEPRFIELMKKIGLDK